ncbi:hypothetical protein Tco_0705930 [Tanacetum coccineum]|uniref:Uncharacterized protein n=1 Tax=Tanacetum coccineum TaxID=301880 RepID=A0ABQ4Y5Z6_9ASTR
MYSMIFYLVRCESLCRIPVFLPLTGCDTCVSELMDADQPSLVKNVLDDVHIDSVVKDVEESENPRKKFPGKVYISPYTQPLSTEVKCKKRRRRQVNIERVSKRVIKTVVGSDGNEIQLLPWKEDLTRSPTAPKRTVSVPEAVMVLFRDKNRMKMRWTFPWVGRRYLFKVSFGGRRKLVAGATLKMLVSHHQRGWMENTCPWGVDVIYTTITQDTMERPLKGTF